MSGTRLIRELGVFCLGLGLQTLLAAEGKPPNVLLILADDLGYGDVQCYNPERGKIPTPHIDRLAAEGMRFTDAHTSSGVCSPTRYTLLTGRYHWRTRLQQGIVNYLEGPLIAPRRWTLASLLKQQGYRTAAIGKWHLGWDWALTAEEKNTIRFGRTLEPGVTVTEELRATWRELFARAIGGGPTTRGFDSYFGTDVPNWPPYCFIENDRTVGLPSELLPPALLHKHLASLPGPALPGWKLEAILPTLIQRACDFVREAAAQPQPFFLYLPLTSPHTPIAVNPEWRGRSRLHLYADFVMETDAAVGRVLAALEAHGVADNTLVIFTSDNGCARVVGIPELHAVGHYPSGPLRGYKADAWEGGHRVPFIVRWPGRVPAGTRCDQLVHQADLMATLAEVLGVRLPPQAGEDSISLLPLLKGGDQPVREYAVSCASIGVPALRRGSWKIIFAPETGANNRTSSAPRIGQLYDLATDLGETRNLWQDKPELVAELTAAMERIVAAHPNDVPVRWRRFLDETTTSK